MALALGILLIIIGLILIVLIILQSGRVKNIGAAIVGTKDVELFDQKKRGFEKVLHWITVGLVISFVAIAFILIFVA